MRGPHVRFRERPGRVTRRAYSTGAGRPAWRLDRLRQRWSIRQAAVRALRIIVPAPRLDQHLSLGNAVEDLWVQQLVP